MDKVKTHIDSVETDISRLGMGFPPRVKNMEWGARSFAYYLEKGFNLIHGERR